MARLQGEVAQGSRRLVEEEARARQHALAVHRDLAAERSQLSQSWDRLEADRRAIAGQRRTGSFLTALVQGGGGVLAGLLALGIAWLALFGLRQPDDGAAEADVLLLVDGLLAEPERFDPPALPPPDSSVGLLPTLPSTAPETSSD
jgi:hypothetical protein